jgi:hypothetical protein
MAHQGQAMLEIIQRTPFSIDEVAKMVSVTRRSVYIWAKKEVLEPYIIDRVGNAIGVDMRGTMPDVFGVGKTITPKRAHGKNIPNSAVTEYWKIKYNEAAATIKELQEVIESQAIEAKKAKLK